MFLLVFLLFFPCQIYSFTCFHKNPAAGHWERSNADKTSQDSQRKWQQLPEFTRLLTHTLVKGTRIYQEKCAISVSERITCIAITLWSSIYLIDFYFLLKPSSKQSLISLCSASKSPGSFLHLDMAQSLTLI